MPLSDATLVRGALAGDPSAFAELYDRYARLIRAACCDQTGDLCTALDLTQEVFLRAHRQLQSLLDPQKFCPWLLGIARQVCREFRRRRRREQRRPGARIEIRAGRGGDRDTPLPTDGTLDGLRAAVAALPEQQRLALHAFYLQGLDVDLARTALGLSRSGFYRVLSSARARLRRVLSRRAEVLR